MGDSCGAWVGSGTNDVVCATVEGSAVNAWSRALEAWLVETWDQGARGLLTLAIWPPEFPGVTCGTLNLWGLWIRAAPVEGPAVASRGSSASGVLGGGEGSGGSGGGSSSDASETCDGAG